MFCELWLLFISASGYDWATPSMWSHGLYLTIVHNSYFEMLWWYMKCLKHSPQDGSRWSSFFLYFTFPQYLYFTSSVNVLFCTQCFKTIRETLSWLFFLLAPGYDWATQSMWLSHGLHLTFLHNSLFKICYNIWNV